MARPISVRVAVAGSAFALGLALTFTSARAADEPKVDGKSGPEWVDTLNKGESARQRALAVDALLKLWVEKQYEVGLSTIGRALQVDTSVAVRLQAAQALGSLREMDAVEKGAAQDLLDAMGKEKDSRVRKEIARSIGRYRLLPTQAVTQLNGALNDPDPGTRAVIAETLGLAGRVAKTAAGDLAPLMNDKDKGVRRAAIIALGRIDPDGASAVAETMCKIAATKDEDMDIRIESIRSVGLLEEKTPAVIAGLAALLADPEDEIRRRATRTLGKFGTSSAAASETLLKVATGDKARDIRVDGVHAFGSAIGPDGLRKRLKEVLAMLADGDFEVRIAVIDEVASLGHELKDDMETMKLLRSKLGDPHIKVREAARGAIERIEKKPEPKKEPEKKEPEKKP